MAEVKVGDVFQWFQGVILRRGIVVAVSYPWIQVRCLDGREVRLHVGDRYRPSRFSGGVR